MTIFEHVLRGCAPVPLASYLKALGVLRLVAEQADPDAKGFWRDERFVLRTRLTRDEVARFFVEDYEPSPIISPWNGRAGFLEGEDEDSGEKSSRQGAELVRSYESAAGRFGKLKAAVAIYRSVGMIKDLDKARAEAKELETKKKGNELTCDDESRLKQLKVLIKGYKAAAIGNLRSEAPDSAVTWFDACQRIGVGNLPMPLLGSGGNDGSRDFGVNFGEALEMLFDFTSGKATDRAGDLIRASLHGESIPGLRTGNVGQYEPGGTGENTSSGFSGQLPFNPFDLVLLLEGVTLFSGATTRRLGSEGASGVSFPFAVKALTAGSGAAAPSDDKGFWEFWTPIWHRAAAIEELKALLTEGRAAIEGTTARDGLEFAVAVGRLGAARGISEFQRYALLQREPRNPRKATPLGRVRVWVSENPRASLVSELDANAWLSRARDAFRDKGAPPSLIALSRRFDEALFRLAGDASYDAVHLALTTIGMLALNTGRRPKLRESLPPPPRLSVKWAEAADDGSYEFVLAEALASLDAGTEASEPNRLFRLPFRCHLGPLSPDRYRDSWSDTTESQALAVWSGRNLARDMMAVLERRLIEAERRKFVHQNEPELPLRGRRSASLAAVAAFLSGQTDDERISALVAGLAWTRSRPGVPRRSDRADAIPFGFAALKPLFDPKGVAVPRSPAHENRVYDQHDTRHRKLSDPLPLLRLMRAGRAHDAVRGAQRAARGAGLAAPFAALDPVGAADSARLAAALLVPLSDAAIEAVAWRVYPDLTQAEEDFHAV